MTQDGIYWLFTASAQTVAAFVALLLAGFALSLGMLDSAAQRDETLTEVIHELKREYHRRLRPLAYLTGLAILTNLLIVLVQGLNMSFHWSLLAIGNALNALAVLLAIQFTVALVDPDRVGKAARRLLAARPRPPVVAPAASVAEFVAAFIPVERKLREIAVRNDLVTETSPERVLSASLHDFR